MAQQDRQAPHAAASAPAVGGSAPAAAVPTWERIYLQATPAQQRQLLDAARAQGVVYAHQLPTVANAAARPSLLSALLSGQAPGIEPLRVPPLDPIDRALDVAQRDAVARALHTPDICLIQGVSGAGKSRVVTEILATAATRGERVLFVAPTAAAIDCALEPLGALEAVAPLRCLARDEPLASLPAATQAFTVAARVRDFDERTLPAARQALLVAHADHEARAAEATLWPCLVELANASDARARQRQQLEARLAVVQDAAASLPDPSPEYLAACSELRNRDAQALADFDQRLVAARAELAGTRAEHEKLAAQVEQLRPAIEARQGRRWWLPAWWRSLGAAPERFAELCRQLDTKRASAAEFERAVEVATADRERAVQASQAEAARLETDERSRQGAALTAQLAALNHEDAEAQQSWQALAAQFRDAALAPAATTAAAVAAAQAAWDQARQQADERLATAQSWAHDLEAARPGLAARLCGSANVVAATLAGLTQDPCFSDPASGCFDLLVLEEAQITTESEFSSAARRARRWVLIGDALADEPPPATPVPGRSARPVVPRSSFFGRLWRLLHTDPRRLPYSWLTRENRLVFRLKPPPADSRWVHSETVADRPEIELRIAVAPRQKPELVEVTFPASFPAVAAREFIYGELQELAVQPAGPSAFWEEQPDRLLLHFAPAPDPDAQTAQIEPGVRERVRGARLAANGTVPWRTEAIEFDRAAGWDRERAERWVAERLGHLDLGRTAILHRPYRAGPELARIVDALLGQNGHAPSPRNSHLPAAPMVFIAVPDPAAVGGARHPAGNDARRRSAGVATLARARTQHGGAGLEIDLAERRRLDFLAAEVRAGLPVHGLVNPFEAQAVVRAIESLIADPAFVLGCTEWQRSCRCRCSRRNGPAIAVIALYDAQADLLRCLIQKSPTLAASPVTIEVGTPYDFRHRECAVALVSLTRSHTHRAVSYGDDSAALPLALTRAAQRVLVFGDAGTLARRCQWRGALDHLDEVTGGRERELAERLLAWAPDFEGNGA